MVGYYDRRNWWRLTGAVCLGLVAVGLWIGVHDATPRPPADPPPLELEPFTSVIVTINGSVSPPEGLTVHPDEELSIDVVAGLKPGTDATDISGSSATLVRATWGGFSEERTTRYCDFHQGLVHRDDTETRYNVKVRPDVEPGTYELRVTYTKDEPNALSIPERPLYRTIVTIPP